MVALGLGAFAPGADWLLMNLEYPVLFQILQEEAWTRYPSVLLSGFMPSQWGNLRRFIPRTFQLVRRLERLGWCAVLLRSGTEHHVENAAIIPG
jgi:hypothetical protein